MSERGAGSVGVRGKRGSGGTSRRCPVRRVREGGGSWRSGQYEGLCQAGRGTAVSRCRTGSSSTDGSMSVSGPASSRAKEPRSPTERVTGKVAPVHDRDDSVQIEGLDVRFSRGDQQGCVAGREPVRARGRKRRGCSGGVCSVGDLRRTIAPLTKNDWTMMC